MFDFSSILSMLSGDPIPNFYFHVQIVPSISGMGFASAAAAIGSVATGPKGYTSVSGLSIGVEGYDDTTEIGSATSIPFPKGLKNDTLTVKRYVRANFFDDLGNWCKETFASIETWQKGIVLKDMIILIMHPSTKMPVSGYFISKAYPVKWETEELNSTGNEALQETVEFRYRNIRRLPTFI